MENMFGEFNEATQLKTSLAKYSIEFNDLAVQMQNFMQTLYITVCEKVCGQTKISREFIFMVHQIFKENFRKI